MPVSNTIKRYLQTCLVIVVVAVLGGCQLTIEAGNGGSVAPLAGADCEGSCVYALSDQFAETFIATPDDGFKVVAWDGFEMCGAATICPVMVSEIMASNVGTWNVIVRFEPIDGSVASTQLSVYPQFGGQVFDTQGQSCDRECLFAAEEAFDRRFEAVADEGYTFTGWQGVADCDLNPVCRLALDSRDIAGNEEVELVATFMEDALFDSDGDGVADSDDSCADTARGQLVNVRGCPTVDIEFLNINGIIFRFETALIEEIDNGSTRTVHSVGTLQIETPLGDVALYESDVYFEYGPGGWGDFRRLYGKSQLPFPRVGLLDGMDIDNPVVAEFGLDYGRNLKHLNTRMKDDRSYLAFHVAAGLAASLGPVSFEAPDNYATTFIFDPFDPSFYFKGDLPGLSDVGVSDTAIGFSTQGLFPYSPDTNWGIGGSIGNFDAHLLLQGVIPFAKYPLELDGELAVDFDPDHDGATPFNDDVPDTELGGNGKLNFTVDFLKFFEFNFELGSASVGIKASQKQSNAYVSGVLQPDDSFLPEDIIPIRPSASVKLAAILDGNHIERSFLKGEGSYNLDASTVGGWIGLDLNNLVAQKAQLNIDQHGVTLIGSSKQSIHPAIDLSNEVLVEAMFTGNPLDWYLEMRGEMSLAGIGLKGVLVHVGTDGMAASGAFVTPLTEIGMSGKIGAQGVNLSGNTEIVIPFDNVVIQTITDGARCGFDKVKDGAICGFDSVVSGAQCGFTAVTSAAQCGTTVVTSAASCGLKTVTSGATCGFKTVTSVFECGWDILNGAKSCKIAKSCEVAKSCKIANTCNVEARCDVAKSCNIPATCDIKKTQLGEFKGRCDLSLGDRGISGKMTGQYCVNGKCTNLAGGRLKLDNDPQACVTIPGNVGEICAPF